MIKSALIFLGNFYLHHLDQSCMNEKKLQEHREKLERTYTEAISTTIETVCRSSSHRVGFRSKGPEMSPTFNLCPHFSSFIVDSLLPNGVFIDPESKLNNQQLAEYQFLILPSTIKTISYPSNPRNLVANSRLISYRLTRYWNFLIRSSSVCCEELSPMSFE